LAYFHCNAAWTDVEKIHFPENVNIIGLSTRNEHQERKTSTMEARMMLDGTVGEITYSGEGLNEWMPLIVMGSWLHVGSTTSMGLGKYAIVEE
jgi:CRISPR/Cas system endoribonuclease Cas6 (RAMP superfamily)